MSLSRRQLFALAGAGAVGATTVGVVAVAGGDSPQRAAVFPYPYFGTHQAGIITPAQDRLHFAAFDLTTDRRDDVIALLQAWTAAAAKMTQGLPVGEFGAVDGPYLAPPQDTGEALDLAPAKLTITFGFGPGLFTASDGKDRFGLADRQPTELRELPHFAHDKLDPTRSDGDLCVQACADDPQVAVHAIRNLARIAFGTASVRWSQLGFGRTSSTSTTQRTPRNMFGFKDGTANIKAEDAGVADEHVWVQTGDDRQAPWMVGGSYLVARRINMHIEQWDRTSLQEQEAIIGRDKSHGAPLSGGTEFTEIDFSRNGNDATPLVAEDSHVRLAHPSTNNGSQLLRRGYNFTDGTDGLGRLDAGLFFVAFVRQPSTQYVPIQTRLATADSLTEYLQHTGSGLFAVPPGVAGDGGYVGQSLFED